MGNESAQDHLSYMYYELLDLMYVHIDVDSVSMVCMVVLYERQ